MNEMKVELNEKEFTFDKDSMMNLLFLMDPKRVEWFATSFGPEVYEFINELKENEKKIVKENNHNIALESDITLGNINRVSN